jgi:hypothetical protein
LRKEGEQLISQPIKGTAKRFQDKTEDEKSKLTVKDVGVEDEGEAGKAGKLGKLKN